MELGLIAIAAAIATLEGLLTTIAEGKVAERAVESICKNPEAEGKIRTTMILGCGLAETCAIYGMLVAFLIIFVLGGKV
ncbi:MAG: F0F1 ATP synthase subunit C [Erysipelotrichaceae bacterium]|nr:F0F1 ATP synthase subunit C [Erysipelotrichaceae bacterium]